MGAHRQVQQDERPGLPEDTALTPAGLTGPLAWPGPHVPPGPRAPWADVLVWAPPWRGSKVPPLPLAGRGRPGAPHLRGPVLCQGLLSLPPAPPPPPGPVPGGLSWGEGLCQLLCCGSRAQPPHTAVSASPTPGTRGDTPAPTLIPKGALGGFGRAARPGLRWGWGDGPGYRPAAGRGAAAPS